MNELRIILVAALCGVVFTACGDDDTRVTPRDLGTGGVDMNMTPVDLGPGVDLGPIDLGRGGGTDGGGGGMCPAGECDLVTNGCGAGEACYLLTMGAGMPPMPLCAASGIGMTGASCTTYSNCAPGFTCQGGAGGTPGMCVKYCCDVGSSAGCPTGAMCSIQLTNMDGTLTGAALCRTASNCAIFGSDCPAGDACYPTGGDGTTDCLMPGIRAAGAVCTYTNDCASGSSCYGVAGGPSTCRKLCDTMDMDPGCTGTDVCTSLGIPAPLANLGTCDSPT